MRVLGDEASLLPKAGPRQTLDPMIPKMEGLVVSGMQDTSIVPAEGFRASALADACYSRGSIFGSCQVVIKVDCVCMCVFVYILSQV